MRNLSREVLYHRHHLSHQQIDEFLGEKESGNYPEMKGQLLAKVNDFLEVSRLLTEDGIKFIPLKGPLLSHRLYGDSSYRYFSDLDILLEVQELKKSLKVLHEKGYQATLYEWPSDSAKEKKMIAHDNQFLLHHPEKNIGIELHWRPFKYDIAPAVIIEESVRKNTEIISFSGLEFRVFNKELELLYLIIHGGLHAWMWLKWLIDIKILLSVSPPDPEKFTRLTHQLNASGMVALCNAMLKKFFPGSVLLPVDDEAPKKLLKTAMREITNPNSQKTDIFSRFRFSYVYRRQCFPGHEYRKSLIRQILYRPNKINN